MKRTILLVLVTALLLGMCPAALPFAFAAEVPTIRFATNWTTGTEAFFTEWKALLMDFAEKNKDKFTLVLEESSGDTLRDKIKTDVAADNMPDVFNYWTKSSIKPFVDAGLLMNVDDYFAVSTTVKKDQFNPDDFLAYSFDGGATAYGFPLEGSTNYMLYNKEIFDKYGLTVPKTQEELLAVSKALNENGIIPLAVGSKGGNPAHFWYAAMFYQFYTQEEADKICQTPDSFASAEFVPVVGNAIAEQVAAGVFPADTIANGDFSPAVALYNQGKAAMIYAFPWVIQQFEPAIIEKSAMMDVIKLPDAKYDPASVAVGGTNFGLVASAKSFADPAKKEAVTMLLDFILGDASFQLVAESGRWATKNTQYDESKLSPLYVMAQKYTADRGIRVHLWNLMPAPPSQEVFSYAMDELWSGAATVEQIDSDINESIKSDLG